MYAIVCNRELDRRDAEIRKKNNECFTYLLFRCENI